MAQVLVYAEKGVQFGSFVAGSAGGTLTVTFEEARTVTGSIILISQGEPFQSAVFGIEAPFGTTVNIINGPDVVLAGSNGGEITLSWGYPAGDLHLYLQRFLRIGIMFLSVPP